MAEVSDTGWTYGIDVSIVVRTDACDWGWLHLEKQVWAILREIDPSGQYVVEGELIEWMDEARALGAFAKAQVQFESPGQNDVDVIFESLAQSLGEKLRLACPDPRAVIVTQVTIAGPPHDFVPGDEVSE